MKKVLLTVLFLMMGLVTSLKPAMACSLYLNADAEKDDFIAKLTTYLAVPAASIHRENLTKPAFSFLADLGADCSGLDRAIITSGYNFTVTHNFQRCTYKGVIIKKAEGAPASEFFVNADTTTCTPLLTVPIHFPLPGHL